VWGFFILASLLSTFCARSDKQNNLFNMNEQLVEILDVGCFKVVTPSLPGERIGGLGYGIFWMLNPGY
jgi:hypothetical protein